jgi:hypothetical protein
MTLTFVLCRRGDERRAVGVGNESAERPGLAVGKPG